MLYDCFTFFDELELLDLRMRVLSGVVDRFVLVESTTTFTGQPKELVFAANKEKFSKYPITHVVVEDSPPPASPTNVWNVEEFQRNCIMRGLTDAPTDSCILVSDADEIAHPDALKEHRNATGIVGFPQRLYYYYVNCLQNQIWRGPVLSPLASIPTPHQMRFMRGKCPCYAEQLGWHFSYMGGVERIQRKLAAFSETQVNTKDNASTENIERCLLSGGDLFHREDDIFHKEFLELDDTYPSCMTAWVNDYPYTYRINDA